LSGLAQKAVLRRVGPLLVDEAPTTDFFDHWMEEYATRVADDQASNALSSAIFADAGSRQAATSSSQSEAESMANELPIVLLAVQ
jgi:hypothetical protein